jgi:hypothetical protein
VVPGEPSAWCTAAPDERDEEVCFAVLPEAVLPEAVLREAVLREAVLPEAVRAAVLPEAAGLLAGAGAAVLADLAADVPVDLLVVFLPVLFLPVVFVPGPAPIFGCPVPVVETVVTAWPDVREPERKGKIA